jgi:hypothetical protein
MPHYAAQSGWRVKASQRRGSNESATLWSWNWLEGILIDHELAGGRLMGGHVERKVRSHMERDAPLGCVTHESKSFHPGGTDLGFPPPAVDFPTQLACFSPSSV